MGGEITAVNAKFNEPNYLKHLAKKQHVGVMIPLATDIEAIANRPASPGTPAYIYKNSHRTNPQLPQKVTIHPGDILRIQKSTSTMVAVQPPSTVKTGFFVKDSEGQRTATHATDVFMTKIRRD